MTYSVKKQDGEFIVANSKGIIIAYFDTRAIANEYAEAQSMDDERSKVEAAFNSTQEGKALRAAFMAEFA